MNNKQSSVDILCQKLANKLGLQAITFYIDHQEEIAEAKAMHKEEVTKFTEDWYHNGPLLGVDVLVSTSIEKHYNETFGGNNDAPK